MNVGFGEEELIFYCGEILKACTVKKDALNLQSCTRIEGSEIKREYISYIK